MGVGVASMEGSHSGLLRCPAKAVGVTLTRVRIPRLPQTRLPVRLRHTRFDSVNILGSLVRYCGQGLV